MVFKKKVKAKKEDKVEEVKKEKIVIKEEVKADESVCPPVQTVKAAY